MMPRNHGGNGGWPLHCKDVTFKYDHLCLGINQPNKGQTQHNGSFKNILLLLICTVYIFLWYMSICTSMLLSLDVWRGFLIPQYLWLKTVWDVSGVLGTQLKFSGRTTEPYCQPQRDMPVYSTLSEVKQGKGKSLELSGQLVFQFVNSIFSGWL